jgi:hypothetical protein
VGSPVSGVPLSLPGPGQSSSGEINNASTCKSGDSSQPARGSAFLGARHCEQLTMWVTLSHPWRRHPDHCAGEVGHQRLPPRSGWPGFMPRIQGATYCTTDIPQGTGASPPFPGCPHLFEDMGFCKLEPQWSILSAPGNDMCSGFSEQDWSWAPPCSAQRDPWSHQALL